MFRSVFHYGSMRPKTPRPSYNEKGEIIPSPKPPSPNRKGTTNMSTKVYIKDGVVEVATLNTVEFTLDVSDQNQKLVSRTNFALTLPEIEDLHQVTHDVLDHKENWFPKQ